VAAGATRLRKASGFAGRDSSVGEPSSDRKLLRCRVTGRDAGVGLSATFVLDRRLLRDDGIDACVAVSVLDAFIVGRIVKSSTLEFSIGGVALTGVAVEVMECLSRLSCRSDLRDASKELRVPSDVVGESWFR